MKIIKNNLEYDVIDVIAGEMLNREHSIDHFDNGIARSELPQNYVGYPAYETESRRYVISAVGACIYVPTEVNLERFVEEIEKAVEAKEVVRLDGREINTKCAHRLDNNFCTTIKLVPKHQRIFNIGSSHAGKTLSRFTWNIRHIDDIDVNVNGSQPALTIQLLAGIIWDANDILTLKHNTLTFEFSDKSFKAYESMCSESVTLFPAAADPLMFELNKYWDESIPGTEANGFMRDISRRKLVGANIDQIEVVPIRADDNTDTISTEICMRCKEPLYGAVYGLSGYINNQDEPVVINGKIITTMVCPLCLHTTPEESPLDNKFIRTLRINWHRTPLNMIDEVRGFTDEKADICKEVIKKLVPASVEISKDLSIKFYLIGDKYVGFQRIRDYRYTQMVNAPFLAGRKVCKVVIVS